MGVLYMILTTVHKGRGKREGSRTALRWGSIASSSAKSEVFRPKTAKT